MYWPVQSLSLVGSTHVLRHLQWTHECPPWVTRPGRSPHRSSKVDGKGGDDGSAKGAPKLTCQSPAGEANKPPGTNFKQGSCPRRHSCNYWHVPQRATFNAPAQCGFGDKGVYKHTANSADDKGNLATIAIHIPANGERPIQLQKGQSDAKSQFRVRLHHFANRCFLKREHTRTNTSGRPDKNPNSAKSKRSNIRGKIFRMDLAHGRNDKELGHCTRTCTHLQVHFLRSDMGCSNQVSASNVSSFPMKTSPR